MLTVSADIKGIYFFCHQSNLAREKDFSFSVFFIHLNIFQVINTGHHQSWCCLKKSETFITLLAFLPEMIEVKGRLEEESFLGCLISLLSFTLVHGMESH